MIFCSVQPVRPTFPTGMVSTCCCPDACETRGWTWWPDTMCGIAGLINPRGEPINRELLCRMTQALSHRGPEAMAVWVRGQEPPGGARGSRGTLPHPTIGLGHTRLRIIDVEGGDQPIWSED